MQLQTALSTIDPLSSREARSKDKLCRYLTDAWVTCSRDLAEIVRNKIPHRVHKLRVIEQVEKFRSQCERGLSGDRRPLFNS